MTIWEVLALVGTSSLSLLTSMWVVTRLLIQTVEKTSHALATSFQTVLSPGEIAQPTDTAQTELLTPPWEMWDPAAEGGTPES